MQRKDEATTAGSTAATGSTTSTEAKGSTTQSTVTASAPSTATTTQTVTDEANLPQDDPITAHGSPEPRISVKGTDGQGTTGQSVVSGVVHGQHITQGNTYNITVNLYGAPGEGMSQKNQPGPISFIINMDGSGKLQDIQAREIATTEKDKRAFESTWSFMTKPVNYALHFTSSLCSALYTLHASVVAHFNGRFQGARPGSLIFVFQHDTWEEAEEMMRHKKDVTDVIVQFLQDINSGLELLECDVQIKALKQAAEDLLDKETPLESFHGTLHQAGVNKRQHDQHVESLNQRIVTLEQELALTNEKLEKMKNAQLAETRMFLWMRPASPSLTDTSGHYSGDQESVSEDTPSAEGKHWRQEEGQPPHLTSRWEVEEGNMKLIHVDRNNMLSEACREGKLGIVKNIIATGSVDVNTRSEGGWTPVLTAAFRGYRNIFDVLVKEGCDLSAVLDNGNNILHVACFGGNTDITKYLVSRRVVSLESKGMYGRTAVMKAADAGNKGVFDLLVSEGSNLSVVDDIGNNILHAACFSDNVQIVDYLISHDIADIESRGQYGRTAVMVAARGGQKKVFDLLVSKGCNLSVVDNEGNTILHSACLSDNVQIVDYLISHHIADIESRGKYGRTAVMVAAAKGKKVFDLLVSKGCNLSVVDDKGNNILHTACLSDNVQIVDYLISHDKSDIESRGQYGRTAVMVAATKGQKKVFDLLVSKGCNLSVVDNEGNNILHVACLSDNVQIVDYLISHHIADIESRDKYGRTAVMMAAAKGKKVFDLLVSKGCNLSVVDDKGNNILHVACLSDNVQIVDYLISHDKSDIESRGQYGRTAVMKAATKGRKKVFDLLVSKGCNLSVVDDKGNNILHVACLSDNVQIVDYLISHDIADIESRGHYWRTAVMVAVSQGQKKVFDLLVSKGCNLSGVDDKGNNILHLSCLGGSVDIVRQLLVESSVDVSSTNIHGQTPVQMAREFQQDDVVRLLSSRGYT